MRRICLTWGRRWVCLWIRINLSFCKRTIASRHKIRSRCFIPNSLKKLSLSKYLDSTWWKMDIGFQTSGLSCLNQLSSPNSSAIGVNCKLLRWFKARFTWINHIMREVSNLSVRLKEGWMLLLYLILTGNRFMGDRWKILSIVKRSRISNHLLSTFLCQNVKHTQILATLRDKSWI